MSALFESVRITRGHVRLLDAHARRLEASGAAPAAIRAFRALVQKTAVDRADDDLALRIDVEGDHVLATTRALPETHPVALVSVSGYDPTSRSRERKSADRRWAVALEADAGDALPLLVAADGRVGETTRANLFALVDGRWVTPAVAGLLPGVTRGWIVGAGLAAEVALTLDELRRADAAFITSALRGVVRVASITDHALGPHPLIERLARAWEML